MVNDEATPAMTFGEEVKARRTALTPTVGQAQIAALADVSRNTISNLERNATEVSPKVGRRIRTALARLENGDQGVSESELIERATRRRIAQEIEAQLAPYPEDVFPEGSDTPEGRYIAAMRHAYRTAARIARGADQ
ncbi:helix-turn-helix domain-containing protein [Nocardiopsis sp. CA-288880]|uniref:helix-turn-helix domain-containing protein n=1 Tax=Nocardiopsis sp. CA-288880 TaxID=3239995 RepID=UPI003D992BC9